MKVLSIGSKGTDVITLQTKLTQEGLYHGSVDGFFGPQTRAAVLSYQRAKGLTPDGVVGPMTWAKLNGIEQGITDKKVLGVKCIECNEITIAEIKGKGSVSKYANSICGTFTSPSGVNVCSILVSNGKILGSYSCHFWPNQGNYPESVIYRLEDGTFGIKRCKTASELPVGVKWAIGGMGLGNNYNPGMEGFIGPYADVRRKTDHNALLIMPNNKILLALCENMDANQINAWVKKINAKYAILLDGGHLAAINSTQFKKRTTTKQGVIVQGVK